MFSSMRSTSTRPTTPDRNKFIEEEFTLAHSLVVPSIMERKAWRQEREAAGHTSSAVRKQRETSGGDQFTFFFYTVDVFEPHLV